MNSLKTTLRGIYFLTFYTMKGTIKKLNERGFGFIAPEEGGNDVFFHANDVELDGGFEALNEGDAVEFEMGDSPKGPKASNIKAAGAASAPAEESSEE